MYRSDNVYNFSSMCYPFFYIKDDNDKEYDEQVKKYYSQALEDVREYLKAVLTKEVEEEGVSHAGVSLILPLGAMDIHVGEEVKEKGVEGAGVSQGTAFSTGSEPTAGVTPSKGDMPATDSKELEKDPENSKEPDTIYTPLGMMDFYTYTAIKSDKDNPVRVLYEDCFGGFCKALRAVLREQSFSDGNIPCKRVLKFHFLCKINDPLNLYKYYSLWGNLEEFFKDTGDPPWERQEKFLQGMENAYKEE